MYGSEIEEIQSLITVYGEDVTLGELLDSLKEHQEIINE